MANTSNLKAAEQVIKDYIRPNGVQAITAGVMQAVLLDVAEAAENDIEASSVSAETVVKTYVNKTENYGDESVTGEKIADRAITTEKIAGQAVTDFELAGNSVTTYKIADKNVTEAKLADSAVTEAKIGEGAVTEDKISNLSVTEGKLANSAVTTEKIYDQNVTRGKLSQEVVDYLLTQDMKTYLTDQLYEKAKQEAQAKFSGTTTSGGTTPFIFGEIPASQAKKTVSVSLNYDGTQVSADSTPALWTKTGTTYTCDLSLDTGGRASIASTTFTHTVGSAYGKPISVTYNSTAGLVQWKYPVYYGYLTANTPETVTKANVSTLTYSQTSVSNASATLRNNLQSDAYLCILTRGTASATQLGISILGAYQAAPDFESTKTDGITMSGYKVYFSTNTVSPQGSLQNVALAINQ